MTPLGASATVPARTPEIDRSACASRTGRHGTVSAYRYGCRCPDAVRVHARNHKQRAAGIAPELWVSALGTRRRLRALYAAGWSTKAVAQHLGWSIKTVEETRRGRPTGGRAGADHARVVRRSRAAHVAAVYAALASRAPDQPDARAITWSRKHGWATPAQWDGVNIDDPAAESDLAYQREPAPELDEAPMPAWEDVDWLISASPLPPEVDNPRSDEFHARDERIAEQLGTTAEMVRRCRVAARQGRGSRAKLTDHDVSEIRRRYLAEVVSGQLSLQQLADSYGVSHSLMSRVLSGRARPHMRLDDIRVNPRKIGTGPSTRTARATRTTSSTRPIPTEPGAACETPDRVGDASARTEVAA